MLSIGFIWVGQLSGVNAFADQKIETEVLLSSTTERQYWPTERKDLYTWSEDTWVIRSKFRFAHDWYLSIAWQQGTIKQLNEVYGDTDFSLESRGPAAGFGYSFNDRVEIVGELAFTDYKDISNSSYYQYGRGGRLTKDVFDDAFLTGMLAGRLSSDDHWMKLSYIRSRDTEPLYDSVNDRAELSIRTWDLSGVSLGWLLKPEWEIGGSLFYEDYESGTPDQLNINGEILFIPASMKQFNLSLGTGYYTGEKETLVNLNASYRSGWRKFDTAVEGLLEYSKNEHSLLYQGTVSLRYFFNKDTSTFLKLGYGQEVGDDQDRFSEIHGGLSVSF
ncbi:MAG: hypothetical protein KJ950_09970 [Proteobacteria bacterium]|nr:hypothetical protein [Pseudomonadota bacterium]MBU1688982.1 hypothetical protein [Pseudomonadota bacterium]